MKGKPQATNSPEFFCIVDEDMYYQYRSRAV